MLGVNSELMYEPEKEEDPLNFLSRHPVPATAQRWHMQKRVKYVTEDDHDKILHRVRDETKRNPP